MRFSFELTEDEFSDLLSTLFTSMNSARQEAQCLQRQAELNPELTVLDVQAQQFRQHALKLENLVKKITVNNRID